MEESDQEYVPSPQGSLSESEDELDLAVVDNTRKRRRLEVADEEDEEEELTSHELRSQLGELNREHKKRIDTLRKRSRLSDHRSDDDLVRIEGTLRHIVRVYDRYDNTAYDRSISDTVLSEEASGEKKKSRGRKSKASKKKERKEKKEKSKILYSSTHYHRALCLMSAKKYEDEKEGDKPIKEMLDARLHSYCVDPGRPSGSRYCVHFVLQVMQASDHLHATSDEKGTYSTRYTIHDQPIFGFFDEVPQFGEYYVFMCAREHKQSGKFSYVVKRQVYQKNTLADLDLYTLEQIYQQTVGSNGSKAIDVDFSNIYQYMRAKTEKIRQGRDAASSECLDARREIFDLLDPQIGLVTEQWFDEMFFASVYIQRKTLEELNAFMSDDTVRLLRSCSVDTLHKVLRKFCAEPWLLCYCWSFPLELRVAAADPTLLELNVDQLRQVCAYLSIELNSREVQAVTLYRELIQPVVEVAGHSFLRQRHVTEFGDELLQAMLDQSILVKRETLGGSTLYYPQNEYQTRKLICRGMEKLFKRNQTLFYSDTEQDSNTLAIALNALREENDDAKMEISDDKFEALAIAGIARLLLIKGCSGSGKSYLLSLLNHYFDADNTLVVTPSVNTAAYLLQHQYCNQAFAVSSLIYSAIVAHRVVKRVEQLVDAFDKQHHHSAYQLNTQEEKTLCDTPIYRYFKCEKSQKNSRRLAILLHLIFNQKVSLDDVDQLTVHCALQYKKVLLCDAAESLSCSDMARLLRLLPRVEKCILLANPDRYASSPGRKCFAAVVDKAFSEDDKYKQSIFQLSYCQTSDRTSRVIGGIRELIEYSGGNEKKAYSTSVKDAESPLLLLPHRFGKSLDASATGKLLHELLERHVCAKSRNSMDDCCVFVRAAFLRDDLNRQFYWWQLNDWYDRLRHADPNDPFKARTAMSQRSIKKLEWSRSGVFHDIGHFGDIVRQMHRLGKYEPHQFFIGERVMLLRNHSGTQRRALRFCPYASESVWAGEIDTIKMIFDYDPLTKRNTYHNSTHAQRAHRNVRRFLVLQCGNRLLCTDYYPLECIVRAFSVLDTRADAVEAKLCVYLVDKHPIPDYINAQRVYSCLSRAREQAVLVCEEDDYSELCLRSSDARHLRNRLHYDLQDIFDRKMQGKR